MEQSKLPAVLIYTPHLLSTVQHYVREHARRLRRYRAVLAGRRRVDGTLVEGFPNFTIPPGPARRLREWRFLVTGHDPGLARFARQHRVELIHAHFGQGGVEILPLARSLGIPLIVTFHGWDVKLGDEASAHVSIYERYYKRHLPRLLAEAREVICVSDVWRERLIALGCPRDKARTNYLGVDSAFFDGERGPFDPNFILFVGRLVRRKGVHVLLEALLLLRARGSAAHLVVAGDGPEMAALQKAAHEQNLPVRFLGQKSPAEIRDLLRGAAVLCAPSTTSGGEMPEALGLVLIEAQAMSVPVVGARNGGIPETLEDGRTGLLVEQEDAPALAAALEKLLGDEKLNRAFGARARAFVCERFDIDRCYKGVEDLYDRVATSTR